MNECASSPCKNGALCKDGANTFVCQCTAGWTGRLCAVFLFNDIAIS